MSASAAARSAPTRAQWLAEQPFTLMLSAGFFGFFSHTGLLGALEARDLVPSRVVGVSAGSLAGGLWASGFSAAQLEHELVSLRRSEFWDPGLPLGGLLKGRKFSAKLRTLLDRIGARDIEQCRVPFSAIVHDVFRNRPVAVDKGPLDVAIVASCTVPLMFRPVWSQGRLLVDGGVSDRCGLTAMTGDERALLHYLPSRRKAPPQSRLPPPPDIPGQRITVITPDLPRVSPFRLDQGPKALAQTRAHFDTWLDDPMT